MASEKDIRKREKALGTAVGLAPKAGEKRKGLLARFARAVKGRVLGTSKSQKAIDASKKMVRKKRQSDLRGIVQDRAGKPTKPGKGAGPKLQPKINELGRQVNTLKFKVAADTAKMNVGKAAAQARKRKKKDKR